MVVAVLASLCIGLALGCAGLGLWGRRTRVGKENCRPPDPSKAWTNAYHFLQRGRERVLLEPLRPIVKTTLTRDVTGHYSLYLEDLGSGANLGINEDEPYNGWSLLKVSVMVAVLKKIEQGRLSLDREIVLTEQDLKPHDVIPTDDRVGDRVAVRELITRLIRLSDNTASFALARFFGADEFQEGLLAMGLPPAPRGRPRNEIPHISPRQYANLLRSLYCGGYLKRPMCQVALALMADTLYDSQVGMGLPAGIAVAHKVGFNAGRNEFHDCGIVFLPGRPYILCVMCTGSTREESDRVISTVSRQIYDYIASQTGDWSGKRY